MQTEDELQEFKPEKNRLLHISLSINYALQIILHQFEEELFL